MNEIKVVELFAGVGGAGKGFEQASPRYRTVYANDNNRYAAEVYKRHWPDTPFSTEDITKVNPADIPAHDILVGGFPCQPFSSAGKRKGLSDIRGTLFYEICRIAKHHRPRLILLENVKGLLSAKAIDEAGNPVRGTKGYVFWRILDALEELGYWVEWQVLNSKDFGVPQNRERVFIIGHLRGRGGREVFPITESGTVPARRNAEGSIASAIQSPGHASGNYRGMTMIQTGITQTNPHNSEEPRIYNLVDHSRTVKMPSGNQETLVARFPLKFPGRNQKSIEGDYSFTVDTTGTGGIMIGNRSRYTGKYDGSIRNPEKKGGISWCLSGSQDTGVIDGARIRRKTPKEDERLQGFPDDWTCDLSDTQRYKRMGNAMTVNVLEFLGHRILETLD